VKDFMLDIDESPIINEQDLTLANVLTTMNQGKMGFVTVVGENKTFKGIIGNADLRHGLLKHIDNLNNIKIDELINTKPLVINQDYTVHQLLRFIKKQSKPILYLPVINDNNQAVGTVNFINLIKGEL
jgi:predicted transcriptional regulator